VLEDRLNHASLLDGATLSRARLIRYAHGDAAALAAALEGDAGGECLVATDGVFSMDGDLAPLPDLARAARERGAWLMVDDAHGLGVVGPNGRGSREHFAMAPSEVPVLMGTLGKAFGTFGAFVAGSQDLIELLIHKARTYIYTTAPPPALAEAARVSLRLAVDEPWRRERLAALVGRLRTGAAELGLSLMPSETPIQPLVAGTAQRALAWSRHLRERGLLVGAIRPPTVPEGGARLRITLSAAHGDAHLERLLDALADLPEVGP
jgi:8-amino-7-oxononanoate synthase